MKKRIAIITLSLLSITILLSGCSKNNKIVVAKPTPTVTISSGPTVLVPIAGGLSIPAMANSLPVVTTGAGVDKFGQDYVNSAYQFAVAFIYGANKNPILWEPNTKKNPAYLGLLRQQYASLADYFTPELKQIYLPLIPKFMSPLVKDTSTLNADAMNWTKLIMIPPRLSDGTLPFPKTGDMANSVMMFPWDFGTSIGAPITQVDNIPDIGPVLAIRFQYTINYPFGDGKNIELIATSTKDMSFWIVPNPSKTGSKWLILRWSYSPNGANTAKIYDSTKMGKFTVPIVEFP